MITGIGTPSSQSRIPRPIICLLRTVLPPSTLLFVTGCHGPYAAAAPPGTRSRPRGGRLKAAMQPWWADLDSSCPYEPPRHSAESRPIRLHLAGESRMAAARQQSAWLFLKVLRPPWKNGQPSAGGWKQTAPRRLSRRRFLVSLSRAASEAGANGGPAIRRGPDIRTSADRQSRRRPPKGGEPHFPY